MNRWSCFGEPVLVGSVAYGLVVTPDIDLEIFCPKIRIDDGFEILKACAQHPRVSRARFWNALFPPHYLKEEILDDETFECPSIQIYRAVLDFDIITLDELKAWLPQNPLEEEVTDWKPKKRIKT